MTNCIGCRKEWPLTFTRVEFSSFLLLLKDDINCVPSWQFEKILLVIFVCFAVEMYFVQPDGWLMLQVKVRKSQFASEFSTWPVELTFGNLYQGALVPCPQLVTDQKMLLLSIGILGAYHIYMYIYIIYIYIYMYIYMYIYLYI